MQIFHATLLKIHPLAPDVFQYDFEWPKAPIDFKPGQFFMLKVQDGKIPPVNRSYSVASPPSALVANEFSGFSLCIKLIPEGRGSEVLRKAKIGDSLEFMAPFGHFTLQDSPKNIVMVATGTGLAPFMSMLPVLFEREFSANIHLYFGVRHAEDLFYVDNLKQWANEHTFFKPVLCVSQPSSNWNGCAGRVTDALQNIQVDPQNTKIYVCGNGQMVKDVRAMMEQKGIAKTDIHMEQFTPA